MNKQRFKKLLDKVKTIPEHKFDMANVVHRVVENPRHDLENQSCGTVGCVVGYLPIYFPDQFDYSKLVDHWTVKYLEGNGRSWTYGLHRFLDIPFEDVNSLFNFGTFPYGPSCAQVKAFYRTKEEQIETMEWFYEHH